MAKQVWNKKSEDGSMKSQHESSMMFPIGEANDAYAKYFIGQSYLAPISKEQVSIFNVTFKPGCRNNWHGATPDYICAISLIRNSSI